MLVRDFCFPLLERLSSLDKNYFAKQKLLTGEPVFKIEGLSESYIKLEGDKYYLYVPVFLSNLGTQRKYDLRTLPNHQLSCISNNLFKVGDNTDLLCIIKNGYIVCMFSVARLRTLVNRIDYVETESYHIICLSTFGCIMINKKDLSFSFRSV